MSEDAIKNDWREPIRSSDAPMMRYVRDLLKALGREVSDVVREHRYYFLYQREEADGWAKHDTAPIILYELTFADDSTLSIYWHTQRNEALTRSRAASMLDLSRLSPADQHFWSEETRDLCVRFESGERTDLAPSVLAEYINGDGSKYRGVLYLVKEEAESEHDTIDSP